MITPPNTSFLYLRAGGDTPMRRLCRVVLRGACTDQHDERIRRSLSGERYFSSFVVDPAHSAPHTWCELVALTPTLAAPTDGRDVEELVAQLEAAALNGWRHPSYAVPQEV